jgi:hypothetical protein
MTTTPNEVLTPAVVAALGQYIPTPTRQQPRQKVVASGENLKALKINQR